MTLEKRSIPHPDPAPLHTPTGAYECALVPKGEREDRSQFTDVNWGKINSAGTRSPILHLPASAQSLASYPPARKHHPKKLSHDPAARAHHRRPLAWRPILPVESAGETNRAVCRRTASVGRTLDLRQPRHGVLGAAQAFRRSLRNHSPAACPGFPLAARRKKNCVQLSSFASIVICAFISFDTGQPALALAAIS